MTNTTSQSPGALLAQTVVEHFADWDGYTEEEANEDGLSWRQQTHLLPVLNYNKWKKLTASDVRGLSSVFSQDFVVELLCLQPYVKRSDFLVDQLKLYFSPFYAADKIAPSVYNRLEQSKWIYTPDATAPLEDWKTANVYWDVLRKGNLEFIDQHRNDLFPLLNALFLMHPVSSVKEDVFFFMGQMMFFSPAYESIVTTHAKRVLYSNSAPDEVTLLAISILKMAALKNKPTKEILFLFQKTALSTKNVNIAAEALDAFLACEKDRSKRIQFLHNCFDLVNPTMINEILYRLKREGDNSSQFADHLMAVFQEDDNYHFKREILWALPNYPDPDQKRQKWLKSYIFHEQTTLQTHALSSFEEMSQNPDEIVTMALFVYHANFNRSDPEGVINFDYALIVLGEHKNNSKKDLSLFLNAVQTHPDFYVQRRALQEIIDHQGDVNDVKNALYEIVESHPDERISVLALRNLAYFEGPDNQEFRDYLIQLTDHSSRHDLIAEAARFLLNPSLFQTKERFAF